MPKSKICSKVITASKLWITTWIRDALTKTAAHFIIQATKNWQFSLSVTQFWMSKLCKKWFIVGLKLYAKIEHMFKSYHYIFIIQATKNWQFSQWVTQFWMSKFRKKWLVDWLTFDCRIKIVCQNRTHMFKSFHYIFIIQAIKNWQFSQSVSDTILNE